jgi:hypothetical protein
MSHHARQAYEEFFSPSRHLHNIARLLTEISPAKPGAENTTFIAGQLDQLISRIGRKIGRKN